MSAHAEWRTQMNPRKSTRIALMAAALSALALSGCVVAPAGPPPQVRYEPVYVAPPPPRVEVVGVAPYPGHFWIGGYWGWNGRAHHWVPGHWSPPRHGHRWEPHRWERHGDGWREHHGRWERH
jgi:hypothetical protein